MSSAPANPPLKAFVVSHTHWDREWYGTREQFRVMLLSAVDRLLRIVEQDPGFRAFMLDGQAVVLEDYCEAKPESRARLEGLIRAGRILVGPWYVLPDEFLVTGEAHIVNFLIGSRICEGMGGCMRVGYLPDSFGHPSQMPQVLAGLGLREIVFWRGLGPDVTETELVWKGPDGTEIFGVNMPLSYGVAACLPEEPAAFQARLRGKIHALAPLTRTGCILLMQGVDHVAPSPTLVANLSAARNALPDVQLLHASLPEYLEAVRSLPVEWQRTSGELRSGFRAYLLGGTLSTRMYLKQQSHRVSVLLERTLHAMAAAAWARGAFPWPTEEIRHAWKLFLQNMPHDSICGCSVDQVHVEMSARLRSAEEYTEALLDRCASAAAHGLVPPAGGGSLMVLNSLGHERTDVVRTVARLDESLLRAVNYETGALEEHAAVPPRSFPTGIVFVAPDGTEIPGTLGAWQERDIMELSEDTQPRQLRVHEASASFVARAVPPLGLAAYSYRFTSGPAAPERRRSAIVENEFLRAQWHPQNATLTVLDKRTGHTFEGLALLEDSGDAGDEYTWSPPLHDTLGSLDPATVRVGPGPEEGSSTLYASMKIPERLEENRLSRGAGSTALRFEITLGVLPGVPRVDLRVEVDNRAEDHRLRLLFPTGLTVPSAASEGVFSVDERTVTPADALVFAGSAGSSGWVEPPSTHPQKSFVSVSDGKVGLTVANRGLPEYEVIEREGAVIAVTLLRSVGWLSRPDLRARKGNGGWTIATPGAQCIGRHVFELSVIPHAADWDRGGGARAARGFEVPLRAFPLAGGSGRASAALAADAGGRAGASRAFFSVAGVDREEIVVSAVKGSERGGTLIIRMWNSSARTVAARLSLGFPALQAFAVSLAEERQGELPVSNAAVDLTFEPWKIRTVEVVPERKE